MNDEVSAAAGDERDWLIERCCSDAHLIIEERPRKSPGRKQI